MAGGIAHDFNNILQAIQGYAQILLLDSEEGESSAEGLRAIEKSAQRAGELTEQLLIFSRKLESKLIPTDINAKVQNVEKLLRGTVPKIIDTRLDLNKDLLPAHADPAQIEQALMNLALNAMDAMPSGGKIIFKTENITLSDDEAYSLQWSDKNRACVLITVKDTGHGMAADIVEQIFEPFFTTKGSGEGTGLGLAMVHGIIESHEGTIICDSIIDKGTTISIYLPAYLVSVKRKEPNSSGEHIRPGNEHVLLVDDETLLRSLGTKMLSRYGYRVTTASTGEHALSLLRRSNHDIDLVLLDLNMPASAE